MLLRAYSINNNKLQVYNQLKVKQYSSLQQACTTTGTPVLYGITQCYLSPGRCDTPAFTPAN